MLSHRIGYGWGRSGWMLLWFPVELRQLQAFLMVAEEEKRIRENPLARTSDLLKKVFGSLSR